MTFSPASAGELDCRFFEEQAREHDSSGHPAIMLEACKALTAYRERLLEENVRYAFGPRAAASAESVAQRSAPLDTFHVLPEYRLYHLARETGVLAVLREDAYRNEGRPLRAAPTLRLRPARPESQEP
ncbi:MAG: hypothetical protein AAF371_08165 [Pseudomonadota bacterium]